jgi:hypothetical protein
MLDELFKFALREAMNRLEYLYEWKPSIFSVFPEAIPLEI